MPQTKLGNMVNPEVMAQMISAKLPQAIKFSKIAKIDTTLTGIAGDTITIPKYEYIGDAEDVAEGVAMGTTVLTTTTTQATVKKAGKAVELTDESVLSGYGDPVGVVNRQLRDSIVSKIDADCITALSGATLIYDGSAGAISYAGIVDSVDLLQEEEFDVQKVLFVHPNQVTTLRKDPDFLDVNKYPTTMVMTGVIGSIAGCQVIPSKRVPTNGTTFDNFIIQTSAQEADELPALTIYLKRDVMVESGRDILAKTTVISADEHYTVALSNESKVVKATFAK